MTIEEKIDLLLEQHEIQKKVFIDLSAMLLAVHQFFTCFVCNYPEEKKKEYFDKLIQSYEFILKNLGINMDEKIEIHAFSKDGTMRKYDVSQLPELLKMLNDD